MCKAYVRQIDAALIPAPRASQAARQSADHDIVARQIELDRAVAAGAFQRIGGTPRHRQQKFPVRQRHGVDHEKIAEAALGARHTLRALRKNVFVVPVTVFVLDNLNEGVVGDETLDEDAAVKKVARVPAHRCLAGRNHHHA